MLAFSTLRRERRKFLALTGLTLKEFRALLPAFTEAYRRKYAGHKTQAGKKRKRQAGGGRRGLLPTPEQRLLFILVYLKAYPLQVVMGELFGLSQAAANQWVHRLLPVLRDALTSLGVRPERDGGEFARPEKQALHYSGKKKLHADKNVVIVQTRSRRVGYLSPTYAGKTHDKKVADCEQIAYPRRAVLHKDAGFQGYEPKAVESRQVKKSRGAKS
jgi:hypothetical protein